MPISKSVSNKNPSLVQGLIDEAGQRLPKYKKQIDTVGPFIVKAADLVDASYPYAVKGWAKLEELWVLAAPYREPYGPIVFGLIMCFFGGSYAMIIAAVEAVRLSIWEKLYESLQILYKNYKIAEEASRKDDQVDADGNGIADVKEITDKELLTRKLFLFARTVDPKQVSDATATIFSGFMAVVATLRVQFAQSITLGSSIGEIVESHLAPTTVPLIEKALPKDMQKWTTPANSFLFRFIGFLAAWMLSRIIVAFHAAVRGSNMAVKQLIHLAKARGLADFDETSPKASALAALVAFLGFWWQLGNAFVIPFPLSLLLLPISIVEWWLEVAVSLA